MTTSRFYSFILAVVIFLSLSFDSTRESKYKLVLFEGSDWCINCIRLEKNVLTDNTFINFMEREGISIERIDFPQRKQLDQATKDYNASMAEKYGFQGIFPTIILVKSDTDETHLLEYHDQNSMEFINQIASTFSE